MNAPWSRESGHPVGRPAKPLRATPPIANAIGVLRSRRSAFAGKEVKQEIVCLLSSALR